MVFEVVYKIYLTVIAIMWSLNILILIPLFLGSFCEPRSCVYFRLSPEVGSSPLTGTMTSLLVEILQIKLSADIYDAAMCGLYASLEAGIEVNASAVDLHVAPDLISWAP